MLQSLISSNKNKRASEGEWNEWIRWTKLLAPLGMDHNKEGTKKKRWGK